ncbi:MAG: hypothetical protein ACYTEQ_24930 [Planctomycetota bacterium]
MIAADIFFRDVTEEQLETVMETYPGHFICKPVPLWTDNGTEENPDPVLLGYHAKVTSKFYRKAKAKWPTKIHLYHKIIDHISKDGFPPHVFGSGGCIETQIDADVDEDAVCRFPIGKPYALSYDRQKAFKIDSGAIVEMTAQEVEDAGISLEADEQ